MTYAYKLSDAAATPESTWALFKVFHCRLLENSLMHSTISGG